MGHSSSVGRPTNFLPRARRNPAGPRALLIAALSMLLAVVGLGAVASPAAAATVYEIDGQWAPGTPGTVAKGDVITSEWRVNVNDDRPAPSNDPVENVNFTVTLQNGQFDALPDLCRTTAGLDPVSSVSADGRTLVCNLGTVTQGTALVVQAPVVADGVTGSQITASGTIAGETDDLDPVAIQNTFGMDMLWGTPTGTVIPSPTGGPGDYAFDLEWTLFQDRGSDAGPQTIVYNLNIPLQNGQELFLSRQNNSAPLDQPCVPFRNGNSAEGHPYSGYGPAEQRAPFVESCTLEKTGPNTFRMTITGIDYSLTEVPTHDSAGNPLPTDQAAVASGAIWLEVRNLTETTSASLTASAPIYTSVTGQTDPDEPGNNTSSKVITVPGNWHHLWIRTNGGTNWDNTFKVAPGTTVTDQTADTIAVGGVPAATPMGDCSILDTAYVDYSSVALFAWEPGDPVGDPEPALPGSLQWYVGNDPTVTPGSGGYNPDAFTGCDGAAGWVSTEPADLTTVKAVRWTGTAGGIGHQNFAMRVTVTIQPNAPIGQDVWTWGGVIRNGDWVYPGRGTFPNNYTPTPGERYNGTNGARDILHVVFATPAIQKLVDRQVVRPGEPATFTLNYSANGSGTMPPTVDDYTITDTLPAGMTYVPGSATPEPSVSPDGRTLTWSLDGVPTNAVQSLTYQAVADDSVTPGQTLTNTATSTLRGETSRPASRQVTVSSSGYTEISKTADTPYIPNVDGSGDGEGSWTVTMRSFDPLPQAYTDVIDILPFEGDQRGTDYAGSYELTEVTFPAGSTGTVYYTTADPATLSDDPADPANGAPNAPSAIWSTTFTPDATAVRVIGGELEPGGVRQFQVHVATDGADPRDTYVNRAQGRAEHTRLVTRTSAPMSMAYYYAATLKKYVQDSRGRWHDAQDVTDYPAFRYGDTVRYRIVVTNVGQGTLTNIDVTDDQQPALGNFHIDELAAGESESHEFEMVLDESTNGTVVNTASATVDTPPDAPPPVIPPDPAGFEVANYRTVKSADPKQGRPVFPGEVINYTITVTQEGTAPADAEFSDDLGKVLDDATYNRDVEASIGTARFRNGHIVWNGTIPVGEVAVVTYSVTVKRRANLDNGRLVNPVTSPGCEIRDGKPVRCRTEHEVGKFDLDIVKDVVGPATLIVGEEVRYRLRVSNNGPDAAPAPITVTDRLPEGLQLVSARGKGWDCKVELVSDEVTCVRDRFLGVDRKAPPVMVVARTTKAAIGRDVVNTARVRAPGDTDRSNNDDPAEIVVIRVPDLPDTGARFVVPGLF